MTQQKAEMNDDSSDIAEYAFITVDLYGEFPVLATQLCMLVYVMWHVTI